MFPTQKIKNKYECVVVPETRDQSEDESHDPES